MEKIMVTGGAGFIGSHVVDSLLARGDRVVCVDDFNDYYSPEVKERNVAHHKGKNNFELYRCDITDLEKLKKIFENHDLDGVIHLAAYAGIRSSVKNPKFYEEVNVGGTLNLLELCREHGIKKFVFASSSSVYGDRKDVPFKETDLIGHPVCPYAATKSAGEMYCHVYSHLHGIDISCLRFFTVYGPRGRPDMAPLKFTKIIDSAEEIQLYGDGSAERDFTYVSDVVDGISSAYDNLNGFDIFNIGKSKTNKISQLIEHIEQFSGKKAKINFTDEQQGDSFITLADISKAREKLGYNPRVDLEEGVKKLVDWHLTTRD